MSINKSTIKKNNKELSVKYNGNLPTIYIDSFEIHIGTDHKEFIRFLTKTPEYLEEAGKFIIDENRLKALIEMLCESISYYPQKTKLKKKLKKEVEITTTQSTT